MKRGVLMLTEGESFSALTVISTGELWESLGSLMTDDAVLDLYGCDNR